jgi:uncharacterized DUF497 family protein
MRTRRFIWPEDRIKHIAHHNLTLEEVEEVCSGIAFVQRAKAKGENRVYYVLGQPVAGLYVFCVIIEFPDGNGYPVPARPMTQVERRRYIRWRKKMNGNKLPEIDSIDALEKFLDTNDIMAFEDELEEVDEAVFERETAVTIRLQPEEAQVVHELAALKGIHDTELIY